jgi:hypothetical protein
MVTTIAHFFGGIGHVTKKISAITLQAAGTFAFMRAGQAGRSMRCRQAMGEIGET